MQNRLPLLGETVDFFIVLLNGCIHHFNDFIRHFSLCIHHFNDFIRLATQWKSKTARHFSCTSGFVIVVHLHQFFLL